MKIILVLLAFTIFGCGEQTVQESISEKLMSEFNTVKSQKEYKFIRFVFPDIDQNYALEVENVSLEKGTGLITVSGRPPKRSTKSHMVLDSKLITSYLFVSNSTTATFFVHTKPESK